MNKIPVTVLTGFLGSGKTTLLNQLMKQKQNERVVIIMNEYGETGIDHELVLVDENEQIYQMNNGCICCVLREDLHAMFTAILVAHDQNKLELDRILIETSGLAEPSPIAQTILRSPDLAERLALDTVFTLVDAENALYQLRNFNESVEQIAFADRILMTKTDLAGEMKTKLVVDEIREISPFAEIKFLDINSVKYNDIIGLNLFDQELGQLNDVEAGIDAMLMRESAHHEHHHDHHGHSHDHDHEHEHEHEHEHHHSEVDAFSIVIDEAIDSQKLSVWLNILINKFGMDLLRYKGILNIKDMNHQVILQGVNMAFRTDYGKEWGDKRQTKIVLIGKNLPENIIRGLLQENVLDTMIDQIL